MTVFIALLRAVNVGGTGTLAMSELRELCEALGLQRVRTYIQSGNALFESARSALDVKSAVEVALAKKMGGPVGVIVRTAEELAEVHARNPFGADQPSHTYVVFYDSPLDAQALDGVATPGGESLRLGARELYVRYPEGMGRSKLKIPRAHEATARNLNTVAKLVAMSTA